MVFRLIPSTKVFMPIKIQLQIPLACTVRNYQRKQNVGEIAINSIPDIPIWDSEPVTVDFTLSESDKSSISSAV